MPEANARIALHTIAGVKVINVSIAERATGDCVAADSDAAENEALGHG